MPRIERTAAVAWEGNLARGEGSATAGSGVFELPFSLASRVAAPEGKTNPEELLAAAHGACFAMSLAGELTKNGTPPERLDVSVRVVMDEVGERGHLVVASELDAAVRADVDAATLDRIAREADAACPFSTLVRGSASVTVRAQLMSDPEV